MTTRTMMLVVALLLPSAFAMTVNDPHAKLGLAIVEKPQLGLAGKNVAVVASNNVQVTGTEEMAKIFQRSEEVHQHSMDEIAKSLTTDKAVNVLEGTDLGKSPDLKQIMGLVSGKKNLRKGEKGFGGLDGARLLLNDMIHECMVKYDAEIAKCTAYYAKQCALMEVARGEISAANYIAATSRALILDAQGNINKCQVSIPDTKQELKDHNIKCKEELRKLNERLKIVMGDIAIMTMILEMSDCDKKFLQMQKLQLLRCKNQCTGKEEVTFNHNQLQSQIDQLHSPSSKELMAQSFQELFADDDEDDDAPKTGDEEDLEFVQVAGSQYADPKKKKKPLPNTEPTKKTKFNNPPIPRTAVPKNPCTDPDAGAPSAADKAAAKCTLKKSPRCYKLQGRFLQIQAEIADTRDDLMEQISTLEGSCDDTKKTLEASIQADADLLSSSQTKLAAATEKEAAAGEKGRQVAKENQQYNDDLVKQMKTCSTNYIGFESELCALKKIRGDLFKKMKPGHPGFFVDCQVDKWIPEECTKKCAGGEQKLSRNVLSHPEGGCKCLPLSAERRCNLSPCPINCKLSQWSGWGKCSAKCGGGAQSRVRDVKQAMKHGGTPCGETSETRQCAVAACSKDCVLGSWTKYTACSKDCDGGTMKKVRFIKEQAEGSGKCAGMWDEARLKYKVCNAKSCKVPDPKKVMKCEKKLDIVLVIDGTPKSGKEGFANQIKAANNFIDAFTGKSDRFKDADVKSSANVAIIHYTGPRTWTGVSKCTGKSTKKVDMQKTCKITISQHFSTDMKKVKQTLNGLTYQVGSKLLSLALMTVEAELALGRKSAPTNVIVFVDGIPLSFRKTLLTSRTLRKKVRLLWVAVTKFSPLKDLKQWASRRWQENLVTVKTSKDLAKAETGTHIVANICPMDSKNPNTPKPKRKQPQ